ncbi:hypothetical protein [Streptomyces sp. AGS-58]|uniref:hypothetical protein n=1 Tax=unclassified Streptomyces TaxID=2593676 RepID=UPI0035A366DB
MTTTESTSLRPPDPTPPQPARPTASSSALGWAQLALCAASVIGGVFIGLTCSQPLGNTLVAAGLGGASIRIVINVFR